MKDKFCEKWYAQSGNDLHMTWDCWQMLHSSKDSGNMHGQRNLELVNVLRGNLSTGYLPKMMQKIGREVKRFFFQSAAICERDKTSYEVKRETEEVNFSGNFIWKLMKSAKQQMNDRYFQLFEKTLIKFLIVKMMHCLYCYSIFHANYGVNIIHTKIICQAPTVLLSHAV